MGRILCVIIPMIGASPSGKAVGSGPTIRGFESLIPSHFCFTKTSKSEDSVLASLEANPAGPAMRTFEKDLSVL